MRLLCPGCDKTLVVAEGTPGAVGRCPACKTRFTIPDVPAAPEPANPRPRQRKPAEDEDDAPPPRKRPRPAEDEDEAPPPPRKKPRRVWDDDDDDREEDDDRDRRPARRPAKKRAMKPSRRGSGGADWLRIGIIGALVLMAVMFGLALVSPLIAVLVFMAFVLGGFMLAAAANVWFLVIAFQDSVTEGLLNLFVPIYSLFYLISHFEETKRPFLVGLAGFLMMAAGVGIVAVQGAILK